MQPAPYFSCFHGDVMPQELSSKDHWLRRFRRAKCLNTLELMTEKAERDWSADIKVFAAIQLAKCLREDELESGRLTRF